VINTLKTAAATIKTEIKYYQLLLGHPKTPRIAKWLLGAALAYTLSPIDLIPDFIPLLGQLDDLVIVTSLVQMAIRVIPQELKDECRKKANIDSPPLS
jgi:uncharacterized membrane protein YkvA (DUF1232 family)